MIQQKPTFDEEHKLWRQGYRYVIGIDEVGRGSFAGPIVAAGVMYSPYYYPKDAQKQLQLNAINDSKKISGSQREKLSEFIKKEALYAIIKVTDVSVINKYGIGKATQITIRKITNQIITCVPFSSVFVLIDGFPVGYIRSIRKQRQKAIIKGDQKSLSIASASIIAKVYRDSLMKKIHGLYPNYNFSKNKGYGTKEHQKAIYTYGLSHAHRTSFDLFKFTSFYVSQE